MAKTITEIEVALKEVFDGKTLEVIDADEDGGTRVAEVRVILDKPDVVQITDKAYPVVAVAFTGMRPASETLESEGEEEVGYDDTPAPHERTMRRSGEWYWVEFEVHGLTLDARADRELTLWVEGRKGQKDSLVVGDETFWMVRARLRVEDEEDFDQPIYHKAWQYEVLAEVINEDTERRAKVAHTLQFEFGVVRTEVVGQQTVLVGDDGERVTAAKDAAYRLDGTVAVTDQDYSFIA